MKYILLVLSVLSSLTAGDTCYRNETLDAVSKTYLSPTVFVGKLTTQSQYENLVRARFSVKKVLKNVELIPRQKGKVWLEYRNSVFCQLPKNLETTKEYLVFVRLNDSEVEPLFLPEPRDLKTLRSVRKIVCSNCAKPPSVSRLDDVTVKSGRRLKLQCKVGGNPLPRIQWYKNGKLIDETDRIKIKTKRKRSNLIIKPVHHTDGGEYKCQASNVVQREAVSSAAIVVVIDMQTTTSTALYDYPTTTCPVPNYCLNGGNCTYYESIKEPVCKCAEGYVGQRCKYKTVPRVLGQVNPNLRHVTDFVP